MSTIYLCPAYTIDDLWNEEINIIPQQTEASKHGFIGIPLAKVAYTVFYWNST